MYRLKVKINKNQPTKADKKNNEEGGSLWSNWVQKIKQGSLLKAFSELKCIDHLKEDEI